MPTTTSRFSGAKNRDNTDRILKRDYQTPAYSATIALAIAAVNAFTYINPTTLTGAVTFTANVDTPLIGDELVFLLDSDATTRTATFGTGFASAGSLAVTTAKYAYIKFIFNGAVWQETGRTVTA
ncbi:hypothetical protein [Mucilaginibacter paludis]|uniref:Uncharacterized protein n=1 Tax=Mucilaginibacter paludis DSM 18603 TaxID=714943 RepID=H1YAY9_9SPHI|nr:hypothetical protein [Mucilaginibacter paludis]EHQ30022.1 hypothetical protein Mucpa_5962 [Mucilaginibacter paludis DSM 18603]